MDAFIPCGAPLSSAKSFVTGTSVSRRVAAQNEDAAPSAASTKMLRFPNLPNISLPDLPFAKKSEPAPPKLSKEQLAKTPMRSGLRLSLDKAERVAQYEANVRPEPTDLPKFYNSDAANDIFKWKAAGYGATSYDVRLGKNANERVNENGTFRNMDLYTDDVVWARPGWSSAEAKVGVNKALKTVFGNAYLYEEDLAELATSISCVTETADMKEFVRACGLSEAYKKRFFDKSSNQRFVELNFKHFLGRAPRTQEEVSEHIQILTTKGYNAEINSYIDSMEYQALWGGSRVPDVNFRGGHPYNNDMNKLAVLNGSFVMSDSTFTKAFLPNADASGFTGYGVYKGLPTAWRGENTARDTAGPLMSFPDSKFWNMKWASIVNDELAHKGRWGSWFPYYYKNSLPYEQIIKPKLTNPPAEVDVAMAELKYGSTMGKFFVGTRKSFDMAPDIQMKAPTEGIGGMVSVAMMTIEPTIPEKLQEDKLGEWLLLK